MKMNLCRSIITSAILLCAGLLHGQYSVHWQHPKNSIGSAKAFEKMEIGVVLPSPINEQVNSFLTTGIGLNPYNPEDISINCSFRGPDTLHRHAFYYEKHIRNESTNSWTKVNSQSNWRIRHSFVEQGNYTATIEIEVNGEVVHEFKQMLIRIHDKGKNIPIAIGTEGSKNDRYLRYADGSETFIPIGHNLTWTHPGFDNFDIQKAKKYDQWMMDIHKNGGNFFGPMFNPTTHGFEVEDLGNYNKRHHKLCEYDRLTGIADSLGMYALMQPHITVIKKANAWEDFYWENNPYYVHIAEVKEPIDFFTSDSAKIFFKRKLRYILSRWGYSPSMAMIELLSEINTLLPETKKDKSARGMVTNWFLEMKNYCTDQLGFEDKIYTVSYASGDYEKKWKNEIFPYADIVFLHWYRDDKSRNYRGRYELTKALQNNPKTKNKPTFYDEYGLFSGAITIQCCTDIVFKQDLWSNALSGNCGPGMYWWWDLGLHQDHFLEHYQHLNSYFKDEIDMHQLNYEHHRWKDKGGYNLRATKQEAYFLVSESKTKILGWVMNSTHYWRNYADTLKCISDLVRNRCLESPCVVNEGEYTMGKCPPPENERNYNSKLYQDKYLTVVELTEKDKKIKIRGLIPKTNYQLTWLHTAGVKGRALKQVNLKSGLFGTLTFRFPLDKINGAQASDYAFKIITKTSRN